MSQRRLSFSLYSHISLLSRNPLTDFLSQFSATWGANDLADIKQAIFQRINHEGNVNKDVQPGSIILERISECEVCGIKPCEGMVQYVLMKLECSEDKVKDLLEFFYKEEDSGLVAKVGTTMILRVGLHIS